MATRRRIVVASLAASAVLVALGLSSCTGSRAPRAGSSTPPAKSLPASPQPSPSTVAPSPGVPPSTAPVGPGGSPGDSGGARPAGPGPTRRGGVTVPSPAAPTSSPGSGGRGSVVIAWIMDYTPGSGSAGGGSPNPRPPQRGERDAYKALAEGRCADALQITNRLPRPWRPLYRGAARACLAAFANRADLWDAAIRGRDAFDPGVARECFQKDVYRLLNDLVEAHRQDPTRTFVRQAAGTVAASTCPRILSITPDHGRRGQQVRLTGANLTGDLYIHFGEREVGPVRARGDVLVVTVPSRRSGDPSVVGVWVEGWPLRPLVFYRYVPASAPSQGIAR